MCRWKRQTDESTRRLPGTSALIPSVTRLKERSKLPCCFGAAVEEPTRVRSDGLLPSIESFHGVPPILQCVVRSTSDAYHVEDEPPLSRVPLISERIASGCVDERFPEGASQHQAHFPLRS